jgi:hypothetical protein
MTPSAALIPRADPDNHLEQLVLIDVADRGDKVVLQSVWVVDHRGRRVTQAEDIVSGDQLIGRLNELIPELWPAAVASLVAAGAG